MSGLSVNLTTLFLGRLRPPQGLISTRAATIREKYLENEFFFRSGKSQGILWMARKIKKGLGKSGKSQGI